MKIYALIAALCVAGLTASFALGSTRDGGGGTTTTSTTTTTTPKQRCQPVSLGGAASAGSVAFTASKTSKNARKLVNTAVALTIPAGARVMAVACTDAAGALTLRSLRVVVKQAGGSGDGKARGPGKTR
jgi:hypothetical protein